MANDLWRTPQWLFNWLNERYGPFDIDLAARADNALLSTYFDIQTNALTQQWSLVADNGFCNPPYSRLAPWLEKAKYESSLGFKSTWVLPVWNGEKYWRFNVYENAASELTHIFGRISFLDFSGKPVSGNRQGSVIIHYDGQYPPPLSGELKIIYQDRDDLIKQYS